jgi:hypothetical protein
VGCTLSRDDLRLDATGALLDAFAVEQGAAGNPTDQVRMVLATAGDGTTGVVVEPDDDHSLDVIEYPPPVAATSP